jgi:hypothetical protein
MNVLSVSRRRLRRRLRSAVRKKRVFVVLAILVGFVVALAAWSSGPPLRYSRPPSVHAAGPDRISSAGHRSADPTASGSAAPGAPGGLTGLLPDLQVNTAVSPATLPKRNIVMTATSDGPILRMGYVVAYGHPARGSATNMASPVRITAVGRSYSRVAAFGVQASPVATYLTCTVTVDGRVTARKTVHGPYAVALCVG